MDKVRPIVTVTLNTAVDRVLEVENFQVGVHAEAIERCRYPAGKGVNVSRCLARLGRDNVATGFAGQEEAARFERILTRMEPGRAMAQFLTAHGATRENITILDPLGNTDTHLRTAGYELAVRDLERMLSKLALLARPGAVVVFGGSLPGGMDEMDFNTLVHLGVSAQSRVVLDLEGRLLRRTLGLGDARIKPSVEESQPPQIKPFWMVMANRRVMAQALGGDEPLGDQAVIQGARRLTTLANWVVVSLGDEGGVIVGDDGQVWRGRADVAPQQIAGTVGSGDCLLAGVLDAQLRGLTPDEVLRWALAAATANSEAAALAEFDLKQVERWVARIKVELLAD